MARLRAISHQACIVASGPDLLPRIVSIKEDIGRLVNALDETVTIWQQYLRQVPETDILPTALEDLQSAQSATQTMFGRLNDVVTNVRLLDVPVLLEGESDEDVRDINRSIATQEKLLSYSKLSTMFALLSSCSEGGLRAQISSLTSSGLFLTGLNSASLSHSHSLPTNTQFLLRILPGSSSTGSY